jgi:hypothetical protein
MKRSLFGILILLFGCLIHGQAQIKVTAKLDSSNILIGDQVRMKLQLSHLPELNIQDIDISAIEQEPKIEVIKITPLDTIYNKEEVIVEQNIILTSFDSGYHFIPSVPVRYVYQGEEGQIRSEQLALMVRTYPIETDSLALQPIKDIISEPISFWDFLPYLAIGLGAVLLIGLIVWWIRSKKKPEEVVQEPIDDRPAHVIALERLDALASKKLWQAGEIKAFHTELSYILRAYLERRFDIRALESTTFEIMLGIKLQPAHIVPKSWHPDLERLLQTADLVKFAKAEPPQEWHNEMFDLARKFVVDTKEEIIETETQEEAVEKEDS